MSASIVSIAANPAATTPRRRAIVSEKRPNIEALVIDPNANNGINLVETNPVSGHSRDLSHHSGRILPGQNPDNPPRRLRKRDVNKTEKPLWLTVVRIFAKNLGLLLFLVFLIQIIRRLTLKPVDVNMGMGVTEFEGRVAEVESFLKTTAKMIQVQVEVVDRKIENEIDRLRTELNKRIEDQTVKLETSLKTLEDKNEELDKSLFELKSSDLLTKEEFEKMYEQMLKKKGETEKGEFENAAVSLSDLGAYAREIVKNEIGKHVSDGLGRVDYALSSGGGKVVLHSEPFPVGKGISWFLISSKNGVHRDADKMLKPSFGEPGQCFALKGTDGFVQIKLRTAIIPEAITLEHVAKSVAYDRSSAPKDCRVSGWLQGRDFNFAVDANKMFLLAEFTYDLEKSNAQTFDVLDTAGIGLVDTVRLDFSSNHGSASHTCIYRLRVHGHEPGSVSMVKMES